MTKTKRALILISQGKSRADIEAELGLSAEERRQLFNHMRTAGYIGMTYVLTDKGRQRMEHVPKTDPKELAYWRAYYYRNKPQSADQIVAKAKSIPNSVFALAREAV